MYKKNNSSYEIESYTVNNANQLVIVNLIESLTVASIPSLTKRVILIQNQNASIVDKELLPENFDLLDMSTWGGLTSVPKKTDEGKQFWNLMVSRIDDDQAETVLRKMDQAIFYTLGMMGEIPMGGTYS